MRQLLPAATDVDPAAAYAADLRPAPADRPWVLINMITSVDGATAVEGVSGGLGGPADKEVFRAIRGVADVIVVAAGTLRAEHYRPVQVRDEIRDARLARGQAPRPRLAVVTARFDLDPTAAVFAESDPEPIVFTTTDALDRRTAPWTGRAEVRTTPGDQVDLPAALGTLRADGAQVVLVEGGPTLNGALVAAGLVDEVCLSLSPQLVGGTSARFAHGAHAVPTALTLQRVLVADDLLFLRYRR